MTNNYSYALCALRDPPPGDESDRLICVPYGTIVRKLPDNMVQIKYPKDGMSQTRKRPRRDPHSDELITINADLILVANYYECQEKLAEISKSQMTPDSRKRGRATQSETNTQINEADDEVDDDVVFVSVTPLSPDSNHQAAEPCQTCHRAPKTEAGTVATPSKVVSFPPGIQVTVSRNTRVASTSAPAQDSETSGGQSDGSSSENEQNQRQDNQGNQDKSKKAFAKNLSYFFDNLDIMLKRWSQDVYELKTECLNRFAEDGTEEAENRNEEVQNGNEKNTEVVKEKESNVKKPKPVGRVKSKGEQSTPKRRHSVKFPLPSQYDEDDPRWTLRYPKSGPGLMELPENSGVFINTSNFFKFLTAMDRRSFARSLLCEIYKDDALKCCSYPGRRSMVNEHLRTLDKHAMTVLLETVAKFGDSRGWPAVEEQSIVASLRSKLQQCSKHAEESY